MTITTEEAFRMAGGCDIDNFPFRAAALRSLAAERDALKAEVERLKSGGCARDQSTTQFCAEAVALKAENEKLRAALQSVLNACDQGRMLERGAGGMTIDAQISRSFYYGVPAWPIEEARAALGERE